MLEKCLREEKVNNYDIFKYLNPNSNTKLSNFKEAELKELFALLNKYYLSLRNNIGLNPNVSFGLELEFEYLSIFTNPFAIDKDLEKINLNQEWFTSQEPTVGNGAEISSPIMYDNNKCWKQLKEVCSVVKKHARINEYCGGHIHVGTHVLENNKKYWLNFLKLWCSYENIIFRFCYGEYVNARPRLNYYAPSRANEFKRKYEEYSLKRKRLKKLLDELSIHSYYAVNFEKVTNCTHFKENSTIEFRHPNGTLEPVIWQNNVNFLVHLLEYSKSDKFNDDIINKRQNRHVDMCTYIEKYSKIDIDKALELSDMIFTNNLDKIYFLRQYLKSFEESECFVPAKNFVLKK